MKLFIISLINIQKILRLKKRIDLKEFFNKFYKNKNNFDLFIKIDNKGLSLLKKSKINYKIKLKKVNKRDIEVL